MINLSEEIILSLIIKAFFTGVALGILYEGVRIVKMLLSIGQDGHKLKAASFLFLFFTDLAFCLIFASSAILLTYNISGGVFRGCVYVSMAIGLLLYRLTVGKLTEKIERFITDLINKLLRAILRLVSIPMRAIFSLVCRIYSLTIGRIIGKIICRVKEMREKKRAQGNVDLGQSLIQSHTKEIKEEDNNAKGAGRYKKEDRISFGAAGRRGA